MKPYSLIFIALLLVVSGCSLLEKPNQNKLAPQLAADGIADFNNGRYQRAMESFQRIKDWYPFDKFAILAELKIADCRYRLEEYDEAILAYQEFENLHPHNEATPYVVYQIGRCNFDRIDSPDRDQKSAKSALATFRRLMEQFPASPYAEQAEKHIEKCLSSIAAHELYVGMFYYKSKRYEAALSRLESALAQYPDTGIDEEAEKFIALCRKKIDNKE